MKPVVVGIDVGGEKKGFHAVALQADKVIDKITHTAPAKIATWCFDHKAVVVAVDAPCGWSQSSSSRSAERELSGEGIHCFATPTLKRAKQNKSGFYKWIFNGEKLYSHLKSCQFPLFNGKWSPGPVCIETFPNAIARTMDGQVDKTKTKYKFRREVLERHNYDTHDLHGIDFIDAALCAVAADYFRRKHYKCYGENSAEGFIIVPQCVTK